MALTASPPAPGNKPLKRPRQARAKATVQAVFDAFVRIWQRDGWQRLTTRAVALEAGIAIGSSLSLFISVFISYGVLRRLVSPQEVADVTSFLASPRAASITGQDINVAAGLVMY